MAQNSRKSLVKEIYKARIKNLVYKSAKISRTDIQTMTGMRAATVTNLVKELIEEGILREGSPSPKKTTQKGRKKIALGLNPQWGFSVGAEIDPHRITTVVIDLTNKSLFEGKRTVTPSSNSSIILHTLTDALEEALSISSIDRSRILGIGIADPGIIERNLGVSLLSTQFNDWKNIATTQTLETIFHLPVHLEGNTNCKLRAELAFSTYSKHNSILFLDLSYGVGASIFTQESFYYGGQGLAGEIGHVQVDENGPLCSCGSRGCLETLASSRAILGRVKEALANGVVSPYLEHIRQRDVSLTTETFIQAAKEGDKLCIGIVEEVGRIVGKVLANTVNILNPELIILGGDLAGLGDLILNPVKGTVKRQALAPASQHLIFELAQVNDRAAAMGAAALILDKKFSVSHLPNG